MTTTRAEVAARAHSQVGAHVTYSLGAGGMHPAAATPTDATHRCDCSGFASWCLGLSRKTSNPVFVEINGGWIETTAIVHDALVSHALFTATRDPQPGDLIVYGDAAGHQGHVGIVTAVENGHATRVVHCSHGNPAGHAVQETAPTVFFAHGAIYAALGDLTQPPAAAA